MVTSPGMARSASPEGNIEAVKAGSTNKTKTKTQKSKITKRGNLRRYEEHRVDEEFVIP